MFSHFRRVPRAAAASLRGFSSTQVGSRRYTIASAVLLTGLGVAMQLSQPSNAAAPSEEYPLIKAIVEREAREMEEIMKIGLAEAFEQADEEVVVEVTVPNQRGRVFVVLGAQWGDEGKGKLVDILSPQYAICARVAGGSNAGHTIVVNGKKHKFHLVPSGILNDGVHCVIGNGVVVHLRGMLTELQALRDAGVNYEGRLHLSDRAHIVFDFHQAVDGYQEKQLAGNKIGTTLKGIGPAYSSKTQRNGVRVGDLQDMPYFEARLRSLVAQLQRAYPGLEIDVEAELAYYRGIRDEILPLICDTVQYCNDALDQGSHVLVEGANATMLDLDFGTYPFVTSSNPSVGSACTGLGVPPKDIRGVAGVVKAYCTRVGEGPFPTELLDVLGETLREKGGEFGTTTGRPRRCGWVDIPQLKYSIMVNGIDSVNLTKLDVLTGFDEVRIGARYVDEEGNEVKGMPASLNAYSKVRVEYETMPGWKEDISQCRRFEDLPPACQAYVNRLQELLGGARIAWIGVGNGRADIIEMVEQAKE